MSDSEMLLTMARRIVASAARDVSLGLHDSACIGAQRGAVVATEAWLRADGQSIVSASVFENLCLSPLADDALRQAGTLLDRHRVEEAYPHRSFAGVTDAANESEDVVGAAELVLAFVIKRLERR